MTSFLQSVIAFNQVDPIGSLYEYSFKKEEVNKIKEPLVVIVAYCLNQNHFHFILTPISDGGIQKFMHRLGTGYTMFFNEKYKRSGSLFQGRYKAVHIETNEYLIHLSAYVNLNDRVHS